MKWLRRTNDTRIVVNCIDAPELFDYGCYRGLNCGAIGDIGMGRYTLSAKFSRCLLCRIEIDIEDGDGGIFPGISNSTFPPPAPPPSIDRTSFFSSTTSPHTPTSP